MYSNTQLLENPDLFGTGNESDSDSEGGSQPPPANYQKAPLESWREDEESPPPETKGRKRKEHTKTTKVRLRGNSIFEGEGREVESCEKE